MSVPDFAVVGQAACDVEPYSYSIGTAGHVMKRYLSPAT